MGSRKDVVLVTGATGRVGRLVVEELVRAGASVRALTRHPESAELPAGVEVVAGDFGDPASLDPALDGAAAVFLVWTVAPTTAEAVVERIAKCSSSTARRVVYLSAPHRTAHPFFQQPNPMRDLHVEIERLLAASGLDVAVVRPGMFAGNALHWWAPQIRQGDVVRWPYGAAETAPVDVRDVAAVAGRVLVDDRHARGDYVLTGPESLTQAAQVEIIGESIGRQIRYDEETPDEFRRDMAKAPPAVAEMLLGAWKAAVGQPAFVTSAVGEILGSPARRFSQWASDHAAAFARSG